MKIIPNDLIKKIDNFKNAKILVIGDLILDRYIFGSVSRISPEAPIPIVDVQKESTSLGGAGNVAKNITSIGGTVYISGVIGADTTGNLILSSLRHNKINVDSVVIDSNRHTTSKTRVIAHHQQVVRIDYEKREKISKNITDELIHRLIKIVPVIDCIIISDYNKGLLAEEFVRKIIALGNKYNKIIVVDPKPENIQNYKKATVITPNKSETLRSASVLNTDNESVLLAGKLLIKKLQLKSILITRSDEGMTLIDKNKIFNIPSIAAEVYDVTGAGDTVTAVLGLGLSSKCSMIESVVLANFAAGIVVREIGAVSVTPSQLKSYIKTNSNWLKCI